MGSIIKNIFDNISSFTQGSDTDGDTFEGAVTESESQDSVPVQNAAAAEFERTHGEHGGFAASEPDPESEPEDETVPEQKNAKPAGGGLFRGFKGKVSVRKSEPAVPAAAPAAAAAPVSANASVMGNAVIYKFNSISSANELAAIVCSGHHVIMSLDEIDDSLARRLLDVTIGICAAANAHIEKVSGRTYYITPRA